MRRFQRNRAIGLGLTLISLCGLIGFELTWTAEGQRVDSASHGSIAAVADRPTVTDATNRRDDWFKDILSRPLFSPDRRVVGDVARGGVGLPRLTGIVGVGSRRMAIFAGTAAGHATVVETGSRIGNYAVRDIRDSDMTLEGPEGAVAISPTFDATLAEMVRQVARKPALPGFFKVPPKQ